MAEPLRLFPLSCHFLGDGGFGGKSAFLTPRETPVKRPTLNFIAKHDPNTRSCCCVQWWAILG